MTPEQPKREAWEMVRDALVLFGPEANFNPGKFGEYIAMTALSTQAAELDRVRQQLEDRTADWKYVQKQKDEVVALRDREIIELDRVKAELAAVRGIGAFVDERMEVLRRTYGHDSSKVAGARWMAECIKDQFDALLKDNL